MDDRQQRRVLVLDDEPNIVSAVQRELNAPPFVRYRYIVEGHTDPLQALARARVQAFDAVVSDYRMPAMSGLEFLNALALIQPDCVRLVLSGQTDMDALVRMVNETHIYRFIPKPWHDYNLKSLLAQALDYGATLSENRRLAALAADRHIPLLPPDGDGIEQLLIVDDDPGLLASLSRVLTRRTRSDELFAALRAEAAAPRAPLLQEGRISVQVTPSARHALKMAGAIEYSCILADYRMPEMNGIELLQRFSGLQPDCARILISGGITAADLVAAVESAQIFAFVDKPWSDFDLKACIAQALARRRMLRENRLLAGMVGAGTTDAGAP